MFPFRLCIFRLNPNSVSLCSRGVFHLPARQPGSLQVPLLGPLWLVWKGNFPLYGLCSSFIYPRTSVFSTTTWHCWFMFTPQSTTTLSDRFLAEPLQLNPGSVCTADCSHLPHTVSTEPHPFFQAFPELVSIALNCHPPLLCVRSSHSLCLVYKLISILYISSSSVLLAHALLFNWPSCFWTRGKYVMLYLPPT